MFSVHNFNEWDLSRLVIIEAVVIVPSVNGINLPTEMSESEDYCRFQTIIDKETMPVESSSADEVPWL